MSQFLCLPCGYIYDEAEHTVKFDDLPFNWRCPECNSAKHDFEKMKDEVDEKAC